MSDDGAPQAFGLAWPGKREAGALAHTPPGGALVPRPEESVDWDTTGHLVIEGDNLDALKLLRPTHAGRVKLVYIDPPYNTGRAFVYRDRFGGGHAGWLSMMYPRLLLARELLTADGFLVVSIDDVELAHLRVLLDEVLGEENFVAVLVFDRNRKNDARLFSVGHEYMVVYARDRSRLADVRLRAEKAGVEEVRAEFERLRAAHGDDWDAVGRGLKALYDTFGAGDPRRPLARFTRVDALGPYRADGNPSWPGGGGPRYDVPHPVTGRPCKVPSRGWVWPTYERMCEEIARGHVVFGPDETTIPAVRTNLFEKDTQVMRSVTFSYAQTAARELAALFGGRRVFDHPKSARDLQRLVAYLTAPGDVVCDFFAGSGTTAHGVLLANRGAPAPRRYVCVQSPERVTADSEAGRNALALGLRTIADVTKERLRRASRLLPDAGDVGFRVYAVEAGVQAGGGSVSPDPSGAAL